MLQALWKLLFCHKKGKRVKTKGVGDVPLGLGESGWIGFS